MKQEVYKSHTHGPIPLGFESRRLMQNLRYAITRAIRDGDYNTGNNAVACARGELALRLSQLELKTGAQAPDWIGRNKPTWIADFDASVKNLKPFKSYFGDCGPRVMVEADIGWESLTPEQSRIRALERKVASLQKNLVQSRDIYADVAHMLFPPTLEQRVASLEAWRVRISEPTRCEP